MFKIILVKKKLYKTSISRKKLRLAQIQKLDIIVEKIRAKRFEKSEKDINEVVYY